MGLFGAELPLAIAKPDGTSFNIQNVIPHQSQKTKAAPETSRAKEFQRGTDGALESAKEGARVLPEGSDTLLGPSGRRFEPCHSDQRPPGEMLLGAYSLMYRISQTAEGYSRTFRSESGPSCLKLPFY